MNKKQTNQTQNNLQTTKETSTTTEQTVKNYQALESGKWASTRSALETPDVGGMV